jgi:methyl-accepting chemotaxis protein
MRTVANRRNRVKLVLDKDFQYRFTLTLCLMATLIFAIFMGMTLFFNKLSYETLTEAAIVRMPDAVDQLKWEFRMISYSLVLALFVFTIVLFFTSLYLSRKIVGPLYALKRRLQEIALGREGVRLRLRLDDEFQDLAEVFNLAVDNYDQKLFTLRQKTTLAHQLLSTQDSDQAQKILFEALNPEKNG